MRVVIFVAVVAAHVIVFFLFPSWRRVWVSGGKDEVPITPVYLPPSMPEPAAQTQRATDRPASRTSSREQPVVTSPAGADVAITQTLPDWHAQAQALAEQHAKQIVAAEDAAAAQAKALTSRFEPLPPPRVRSPGIAWDYAATHRITALPQGGFVYSINDNCQLAILPMPFIGCVIGKPTPNGELFENVHPPMKYGDWDWRFR